MGDVLPFSSAATPDEEAQQWIIRIDRAQLTADEREALHAWLARDARHGRLLDEHAKLWHAAGKARETTRSANAAVGNSRYWKYGGGLAGLIAAGLAAFVVGVGPGPFGAATNASSVLQTAAGQHQRFVMSDGSHVELNTKSKAIVHYVPSQRQIVLESGEGYFEVAKDRSRPFTVVAGGTTVRAVGTRFSVLRRANGDVDVVVSEGIVQVTRDGDRGGTNAAPLRTARLVAGQSLATNPSAFVVVPVNDAKIAQLLAWQQGRVTFDQTPLSSALEEMSRYTTTPIKPGDAGAASTKVSGSFATDNLEAFLRSLEVGFGLKIQKRADAYIVVSAKQG